MLILVRKQHHNASHKLVLFNAVCILAFKIGHSDFSEDLGLASGAEVGAQPP
jgi:hypothetical protein